MRKVSLAQLSRPLFSRRTRPLWSLAVVAAAAACYAVAEARVDASLGRRDWFSGFALTGACVLLIALPIRRRLALLQLGRVAIWQQVHHYAGLFGVLVYLAHAGLAVNGQLEVMLAAAFWLVSLSGVGHWYFNRRIPKLMAVAGKPVRFQEIRPRRRMLADQAYAAALAAAVDPNAVPLAELYTARLASFFESRRSWSYFARPTGGERRQLLSAVERAAECTDANAAVLVGRLRDCIVARDNTDFQSAMMWRIRCWNALHTSGTYVFVALAALHIVTVLRFT